MLVSMKKASWVALLEEKQVAIAALQSCGALMAIEETNSDKSKPFESAGRNKPISEEEKPIDYAKQAEQTLALIEFLKSYQLKKEIVVTELTATKADYFEDQQQYLESFDQVNELYGQVLQLQKQIELKKNEIEKCKQTVFVQQTTHVTIIDQLLSGTNYRKEKEYTEPPSLDRYDHFIHGVLQHFQEDKQLDLLPETSNIDITYQRYLILRLHEDRTKDIEQHNVEIEKLSADLLELEKRASELSTKKADLQRLYDQQQSLAERQQFTTEDTKNVFYLQGWVRADQVEEIQKTMEETVTLQEINFADPQKDETPPSVVKNNVFTAPFSAVTNMYARPSYRNVDPNPLIAPFYSLFFGMMMGDAGYGLLILLAAYAFLKIKKPRGNFRNIVLVIMYGCVSSIFWGIIFGSFFSLEIKGFYAMFSPMQKPIEMLVLCMGLGLIHIFVGMITKMYIDIRDKKFWDAILDQLVWIVLIVGLVCMAIGSMMNAPVMVSVGTISAVVCAILILVFGGRKSGSIVGKIMGGFGALYGIMNYLGDVLSYARILALMLSSAVIAMVVNILVKMMLGLPIPINILAAAALMVGGHIFNILISTLGVYIHTARLQYIEFFGRFFEGGGIEFTPFSLSEKFTVIRKNKNNIK